MSTPRRHHILPIRYQSGFAIPDGRVWVQDRRRGGIACEHPKSVAAENYFYTSESADSPSPAAMEGFLAEHVEKHFWPVLDSLERKEIPTTEGRDRVAIFSAFLLTRIAVFREKLTRVLGDVLLSYNDLGPELKSLEGFFKISSGGLFIPQMPKNNSLFEMGRVAIEASKILMTLNTHIMFSPPEEPFITTDNPFVFDRLGNSDQPPTVSDNSFMKWIPLSGKVAVGFWWPGNAIYFQDMDAAQVRQSNIRLAKVARQIVIANSRQQLEKVLATLPKVLPEAETRFPSEVS